MRQGARSRGATSLDDAKNIQRRFAAARCGAQYKTYLEGLRTLKSRLAEWSRHDNE